VCHCVDVIEAELRARAVDPRDPTTWTEPVVRFACPEGQAFAAAGTSPALLDMYDALLGAGRWARHEGVGGTLPVRFPSVRDPGDAGWHIDGSYDVNGAWWVNVRSRGRGLLALFLFTDVGDDDAPTELIVGSHLDVPRVLAPFGERGVFFGDVVRRLPAATSNVPAPARRDARVTYSSAIRSWSTEQRGRIAAPDRAWSPSPRWRFTNRSHCGLASRCGRSSAPFSAASSGEGMGPFAGPHPVNS